VGVASSASQVDRSVDETASVSESQEEPLSLDRSQVETNRNDDPQAHSEVDRTIDIAPETQERPESPQPEVLSQVAEMTPLDKAKGPESPTPQDRRGSANDHGESDGMSTLLRAIEMTDGSVFAFFRPPLMLTVYSGTISTVIRAEPNVSEDRAIPPTATLEAERDPSQGTDLVDEGLGSLAFDADETPQYQSPALLAAIPLDIGTFISDIWTPANSRYLPSPK
jgi:hypothetical protein